MNLKKCIDDYSSIGEKLMRGPLHKLMYSVYISSFFI